MKRRIATSLACVALAASARHSGPAAPGKPCEIYSRTVFTRIGRAKGE